MLHIWRPYPLMRPKEPGYYLCTLRDGTMRRLYFGYNRHYEKVIWTEESRQSVFDGYRVYQVGHEPAEHYRVYTDSICDKDEEVVAWTKEKKGSWLWRKLL